MSLRLVHPIIQQYYYYTQTSINYNYNILVHTIHKSFGVNVSVLIDMD